MAKKKSGWTKYRRYGYGWRKWKSFAKYNYFNAKIEYNDTIAFPTNSNPIAMVDANSSTESIGTLIENSADFQRFRPVFTFYRLRGMRVEITPTARNLNNSAINYARQCYFAFTLQGDVTGTIAKNTDKGMILNPIQKTTKYWNVYGMQDDWKTVSTVLAGNIGVFSDINSTSATGPTWSMHITFYLTFKYSKV